MKLKKFLKQFFETFLPSKYSRHVEKQLKQVLELYFSVLFIAMLISFLIYVPVLKMQTDNVGDILTNFDKLNISVDLETNNSVTLINSPKIVVDTNATGLGNARLLISKDKLFYKTLFKENEKERISTIDLTTHRDKLSSWFFLIAILLLPAYILGLGLVVIILNLLLVALLSLIGKKLFKKRKLSFRDCFLVGIHASIPGLFLFLILLPFQNYFWIGLVLFLVLYILSLSLLKELKFESLSDKN